MFQSTVKLFLLLKVFSIHCDRSFTVVLDTTVSMREEINVFKGNIGQVVNSINRTDIGNYVLVPFKDLYVEVPFSTESPRHFVSHSSTITTSGGSDCPENSLAGIEEGLRVSKEESYIFVFTDAYAKDYDRFQFVENLCKESHSQVIVFLSGFCAPSQTTAVGSVDVYYDIAKACSGAFFRFDTTFELRQAFNFMKEVVNTEWTDITPQDTITNHKETTFVLDAFTTNLMIVVTGRSLSLSILDSSSQTPRTEMILNTRHGLVVGLIKPDPGQYSVLVQGHGPIMMTFYERNYIPFQYGFSTKLPRSLKETSERPIGGRTNYLMISMDISIKLTSVEWLSAGENEKKVLYLEEKSPGFYVTNTFVEPGKSFRFWIIGQDKETQQNIRGSTKYISPQVIVSNVSWIRPDAEILDTELILIDFGTEMTLACKIVGFPKPNIRWEDEDEAIIPSEDVLIEIPSVYVSYVTLNVTKNSTIYCKCENSDGTASQSINIYVKRPFTFDVKKTPEDTSVEYGEDLTLRCDIEAYPDATVKWTQNGTEVDSSSRVTIEENSLVIKNVSLEDGGEYNCIASNEVETRTFPADVSIAGLEVPEIETRDSEINVKPGESVDIECSVIKGKPLPVVQWQFKSLNDFEFNNLPLGVTIEDGKATISSITKEDSGVYRCTASNIIGKDFKDVTVNIQYAPIIKNDELETLTVKEDDSVQLPCDVDAIPEATVHWEMSQDDVMVALDGRHKIDGHSLVFTALWNDSGNYHCFAENNAGKAERTITLIVLVPPYIETPKAKNVTSKLGGQVDFACNILYGNPAPTIKWEFIAVDSTTRLLNKNNTTLRFDNVSLSDEGTFMCLAENQIGMDTIKYYLRVH